MFLFAFNLPLAEFTSMLWFIILHEYKPLTHKSPSRWDCVMLHDAVLVGLIQFALYLVQIPHFAMGKIPHHNRASSMLYDWYDRGDRSSFTNSSLHLDHPIWMIFFWVHHMDANKTAGEEARRQLHKNAACNLEQVLAATPHKTPTVRPPAPITKTIQVRRTRHAGHCWRSRDELIRDVLLWTPTHGREKAGRPARTYIQQLCEDTGCCPEDLPEAMNDREEWRERVRDIRATSATWWWWWWWWFDWKNSNFDLSVQRTLLHCSIVQS